MAERPGTGDVHVDMLLTNMSVGIANQAYISRRIFPELPVNFQSDIIPRYNRSDWHRNEAKALTEREAPPVGGYNVDVSDKYFCQEFGVGHFISRARRANTQAPFDADRDGLRWVMDKMELAHERSFVADFWKTGVWGTDLTGGSSFTKWNTYATSTPIVDIRTAKRTIRRALSGLDANVLVLGDLTFDRLADHPNLLDRIKYGHSAASPAMVTPNLVAQLLGLDDVPVGMTMYTTSPLGTAEASVTYTAMWDDDGLLLHRPARPSLFAPAAGYKFTWTTVWGTPRYVRRREDPQSAKGDLIEIFEYWDQKAVSTGAGVFFSDAVD